MPLLTDEEDGVEIAGGSVSFFVGYDERRKCFGVETADDTIHEPMESYRLTLLPAEGQSRVVIQQRITDIFILNDDGKHEI